MYVRIYKKQKKERKKLKKFFVIIGILLVIFISLLIYRKSQQKNIVTASEVDNIQNYISEIYMWKEVTGEALPVFDEINNASDKWIWEVVKKNIDNYDSITYNQIQDKIKEIFGQNCTKQFPKEGNEAFLYNEEAQNYEPTITQIDSDNDVFIINEIQKEKDEYIVEIVEYIEDYSQEKFDTETGEELEYDISIKNLSGDVITSVKNTEGETKIIEQVKANIDKFSKKIVRLTIDKEGKIFVKSVQNK